MALPKKILLLGLNGRGGPITYSCLISSYLSKCAHVSLLIPSYSDTSGISKKVKVIRVNAPADSIKTFFLTLNIFQHIQTIRKLNNENAEVINILDIHPWFVLYWPFLKAKKKIVTINDPEVHSGEAGFLRTAMIKAITRFLLKNADHIVALSASQVPVLRKLGYKQPITASKLGNQQEFSLKIHKRGIKTEPKSILFFGRIRAYKGLDYLLKALIQLKNRGMKFKLIIAGEGNISPYQKLLDELGDKYLELHIEYISDDRLSEYFQRSGFVVLPYTDATQTGIASISYHFKKPLVVTKVGSLSEVVKDKITGFVIEPKNIKQLSEAIEKMLSNPDKTKKMGVDGNIFLAREYSWEKIAKDLFMGAYKIKK